jgi:rubredoxin
MYDEEEKSKRGGLPKRWTHREFVELLIYDMINPPAKTSRRQSHVTSLSFNDDTSSQSSLSRSSRTSGTKRSSAAISLTDDEDYECESGWEAITKKYKVDYITTKRLNSNFFVHRLDGKRHPAIHTSARCQYCYYIYNHVLTDEARKVSTETMFQNRMDVRRCLTCNVNLCVRCEMEFHGITPASLRGCVPGKHNSK